MFYKRHRMKIFRTLNFVAIGNMLIGPVVALAAPPVVLSTPEDINLKILCPIANILFTIALVVGIIMAIVAAYKYLTSGGDANKVGEAHQTLTYAAIGIGVAILAGSFPTVVGSLLGWATVSRC